MGRIARSIPKPLKTNVQEGAKTPVVHYQSLHEMGYKVIAYSSLLQRAQIQAGIDALETVKREGSALSLYPSRICDHIARSDLLDMSRFYELEERLYGPLLATEGSQREKLEIRAIARRSGDRARLSI